MENQVEKEKFDLLSTIAILFEEYEDQVNHTVDCTISFGDNPHKVFYFSPDEEKPFCIRYED